MSSWGSAATASLARERLTSSSSSTPSSMARSLTRSLLLQGAIVTLLCLAFTFQPTVASAYFMISVLTIQMYLLMYLMLFAAALRLRSSHASRARPFRVPGGAAGLWIVSGLGILGALVALGVGFFPPAQLTSAGLETETFVRFLTIGLVASIGVPLACFHFRRPGWERSGES